MPHGESHQGKVTNPTPKQNCLRRGGTWNEATQICTPAGKAPKPGILGGIAALLSPEERERQKRDLAKQKRLADDVAKLDRPRPVRPQENVIPPTELEQPEVFRKQEGEETLGRQSGIKLPDGRTFLGLSPDDVAKIAGKELEKETLPEGTALVGTQRIQEAEIRRKIALAKTIGVIDFATAQQIEEQGLNVRELVSAGFQNIDLKIPAVAIAAGLSAAPATRGISALGGLGIAGGSIINDFQKGVRANIKSQRSDLVSLKPRELKARKQAIQNFITVANMNPVEADDMVANMALEETLIRNDLNTLIHESESNLVFWGSDATLEIAAYDVFFESVLPSLQDRMNQAVLKPDPTRAFIPLDAFDIQLDKLGEARE